MLRPVVGWSVKWYRKTKVLAGVNILDKRYRMPKSRERIIVALLDIIHHLKPKIRRKERGDIKQGAKFQGRVDLARGMTTVQKKWATERRLLLIFRE